MATKITGLTGLNARALREVDTGTEKVTATTATWPGTPRDALAQVVLAMAGLSDRRGHPYASLYAVVRKLDAQRIEGERVARMSGAVQVSHRG